MNIPVRRLLSVSLFNAVVAISLSSCDMSSLPSAGSYGTASGGHDVLGEQVSREPSYYLAEANLATSPRKEALQMDAAQSYLQENKIAAAQKIIASLSSRSLTGALATRHTILQAKIHLLSENNQAAVKTLQSLSINNSSNEPINLEYRNLLAIAYSRTGLAVESANQRLLASEIMASPSQRKEYQQSAWQQLQQASSSQLQTCGNRAATNPELAPWCSLAYLQKTQGDNPGSYQTALSQWRQQYPNHPAEKMLSPSTVSMNFTPNIPSNAHDHIVLLLPLHGKLASASRSIRDGFMASYYQNQKQNPNQQQIQVVDTTNKDIVSAYQQAISQGATFIVGPLDKPSVEALTARGNISVPTLTLNYSKITPNSQSTLYQFGLSPLDEANQAAERAVRDGRKRAIVIAPQGEWGNSVAEAFSARLQQLGGSVIGRMNYAARDDITSKIKTLLRVHEPKEHKNRIKNSDQASAEYSHRRRHDFDIFFLVANPSQGQQIRPLLRYFYAGDVPVLATSTIYDSRANVALNKDLDGVMFGDIPWLLHGNNNLDKSYNPRLYAMGMDAFELSQSLSQLSPSQQIPGKTGALSIGENHKIYRNLEWAQIQNGTLTQIG